MSEGQKERGISGLRNREELMKWSGDGGSLVQVCSCPQLWGRAVEVILHTEMVFAKKEKLRIS